MHQRYRGFTEEFRLYMNKRSGWPLDKSVYDWFRANRGGLKKGVYSTVKHGDVAGEKFVAGFVACLVAPPESDPSRDTFRHSRLVLLDYLRERGIHTLTQATPDAVLAHVAGPAVSERPSRTAMVDYLRQGAASIGDFVAAATSIDRYVQACDNRTDADVQEAVRWMYVKVGRCLSPRGAEMTESAAEAAAVAHIRLSLADYQLRAATWQRFNPWTVVYARDKSSRVGMSIVLPLQDGAYQDILDGKRASYDMTPGDLASPTANLLIEACAEHPGSIRPADANPTRGLLMALGIQLAALSRCRDLPAGTELRLLSFAGTPTNRDRLLDTGFKATGRTMARTGAELLEHRIPLGTWRADVLVHVAMFRFFSELCDGPPPE